MSELGTEILAARQMASLRHHGWSTLEAAAFVTGSLPAGHLRETCEAAIQHLRAGAAGTPPSGHPLGSMVAGGDLASGASFEALAEAWEAQEAGRHALSGATRLLTILVAGPLLLGTVMGWLLPRDWPPATDLPAITAGVVWLVRALRFLGLPLAAAGVWAVRRLAGALAPGAREFRRAAQLLQLAAAPGPGAPGQSTVPATLPPMEQWYFHWRRALAGVPVAARELAAELLRSGREKAERFNQVAPIGGAVVAFVMFSVLIGALYVPLFKMAGSFR